MWFLEVLDYRNSLHDETFGADDEDWVLHGPFKSEGEAYRWWMKLCDDIYSEAESDPKTPHPIKVYAHMEKKSKGDAASYLYVYKIDEHYHIEGCTFFDKKRNSYYEEEPS